MAIYRGIRSRDGAGVTVQYGPDSMPLPLAARLDLCNHSPTGFGWGYAGSGPAQLALAILAHHLGDDRRALQLYQQYQLDVIAALPYEGWAIETDAVEAWVAAHATADGAE